MGPIFTAGLGASLSLSLSDGKVALVIGAQRLENIDQYKIARISVLQYRHYCKK